MSYKEQYFEWEVPLSEVSIGDPVGYEVFFSKNPSGQPVSYKLSTFDENNMEPQGVFFYSLDNGETWIDFPQGEDGHAFSSSYRIKVKIAQANIGYIYAARDATIYRISPDGKQVVSSFEINGIIEPDVFEIYSKQNIICVVNGKTMYKLDANGDKILPHNNSINLIEEPFDIAIDSLRNSFWQIGKKNICLKSFSGETIMCKDLIDVGQINLNKGIGYGKIGIDFGVEH